MPKDDLGISSAELVFRSLFMVPGELMGHGHGELIPNFSATSVVADI